jgi:hypothetical protein
MQEAKIISKEKEQEIVDLMISSLEFYRQIIEFKNKGRKLSDSSVKGFIDGIIIDMIQKLDREPCYQAVARIKAD